MQQVIGMRSVGMPEFSPAFGNLPQSMWLPPGQTFTQGGSFFGPQLYNPHHFTFGSGFVGQGLGQFAEQFANQRGYQYFPTGVNAFDVMRGRQLESGLQRASDFGTSIDEGRLARAIEQGFKLALGSTSPATMAHANTLASQFTPMMQGLGFFNMMPGGSASDFARHIYMASQNVRDFTRSEYHLGMSDDSAQGMVRRMTDFFAPTGRWDAQRMRGLGFGEMGQLASSLTRYGLLRTGATDREIMDTAERNGMDTTRVTQRTLDSFRDSASTANMGRRLQEYADVIGTMREIMGAPDAPIPTIISELQQFTGGQMQQMDPAQVQQLLYKVKELGRTANISMEAMTEIVKMGSTSYQQMGLNPILGGQVAQSVYAATVASQTFTPGTFIGRFSPNEEVNVRHKWMTRGVQSSAANMSMQMRMMLNELSDDNLDPSQRALKYRMLDRANNFEFSWQNVSAAQEQLSQLGIGNARSWSRLNSTSGVQEELARNPQLLTNLQERQVINTRRALSTTVQDYYRFISEGGGGQNDTLVKQLGTTAAANNISVEELLGRVTASYSNAPTGEVSAQMAYLKSTGLDIKGLNGETLFGGLRSYRGMEDLLRGRDLADTYKLSQLLSEGKLADQRKMEDTIKMGMAGQTFLSNLNVSLRGSSFDRVMGAVAGGEKDLTKLAMTAFNFMPSQDFMDILANNKGVLMDVSNKQAAIANARTPEERRRLQGELEDLLRPMHEQMRKYGDVGATRHTQALIQAITPETIEAARNLGYGRGDTLANVRTLSTGLAALTDTQVMDATSQMSTKEQRRFRASMNLNRTVAEQMMDKFDAIDTARKSGDTATVDKLETEILQDKDALMSLSSGLGSNMRSVLGEDMRLRTASMKGRERDPLTAMTEVSNAVRNAQKFHDSDAATRDDLSNLQSLAIANMDAFTTFDKTGKRVFDPSVATRIAMSDKRFIGDKKGREKFRQSIIEYGTKLVTSMGILTTKPEYDMSDKVMNNLLESSRLYGVKAMPTSTENMLTGATFTEDEIRDLRSGKLSDEDFAARMGDAKTPADRERVVMMRDAHKKYQAIESVRRGLEDWDDLSKRDKRVRAGSIMSTLRNAEIMTGTGENATIAPDVAEMIYKMRPGDEGFNTVMALEALAPAMGKNTDVEAAIKRASEAFKAQDKTETGTTTEGGPQTDSQDTSSITVAFKDPVTGENLGNGVQIVVGHPKQNQGREASKKAMPRGPDSVFMNGVQVA